MLVTFLGAAGEVTGSCTLVETGRARVLVDFGLHQGDPESEARNVLPPQIDPSSLDAVVLTHAHLDHCGRLPLLFKAGYKGRVWCTPPTVKLAPVLLQDAAMLQENDAARDTIRNERRGDQTAVKPLFERADVPAVTAALAPLALDRFEDIAPGVRLRFTEAGHILGAASVELRCAANDEKRAIVFSGDIGPRESPLMREPVPPVSDTAPDLVVLESTYGDRDHRSLAATEEEFDEILREAVWNREKILFPAFAIGRAQTILYEIDRARRTARLPEFPVYLDSPMAITATRLYEEFWRTLDGEGREYMRSDDGKRICDEVACLASGSESRQLNDRRGGMAIIAGSGMCNGGRIVHHLRHNVYKPDTRIVISGFQAENTLGRRLVERPETVRIMGETLPVRARIHTLGGFSAHAGRSDLLRWAGAFKSPGASPRFVLTHGENPQRATFKSLLESRLGASVFLPERNGAIEV